MKELTAKHEKGFEIRSLIESAIILETISDLRTKGFTSFIIKTVANVNPDFYTWEQYKCLSRN